MPAIEEPKMETTYRKTFAWVQQTDRRFAWDGFTTGRMLAEDLREGDVMPKQIHAHEGTIRLIDAKETSQTRRDLGDADYYYHVYLHGHDGPVVLNAHWVIEVEVDFTDMVFVMTDETADNYAVLEEAQVGAWFEGSDVVYATAPEKLLFAADLRDLVRSGYTLNFTDEDNRDEVMDAMLKLPTHTKYDEQAVEWSGDAMSVFHVPLEDRRREFEVGLWELAIEQAGALS
jgi:hypothetical protein